MNHEGIDRFEQIDAQLEALYVEISLLSKSKPNDAVNKFKLKFINSVLESANEALDEKNRPFSDFEQFSEDELPSNSDVVFMLAQYRNSLDKLRSDNVIEGFGKWYWVINKEKSDIRSKPPHRRH